VSGHTLSTFGFMKSTKRARFTLICWFPGYQHGFRNTRHRMVLSVFARRYLTNLWATGRSGRGLLERQPILKWAIWWTFSRWKAYTGRSTTLSNISRRKRRDFMLRGYVKSRPLTGLGVHDLPAMGLGLRQNACFAATCRKARACMMHLENCGYPTSIGPKI